jgi:hypothetical protein
MNDSIDQNVYEDLHARVNDGDDGLYGINNPLERLNSSRNQVVLAWDQAEPLLIHTDLKTCQQCGSKMRNAGGKKECDEKRCDKCGWSVMRDGFPALVKLDHGYPSPTEGDVDPNTGEFVPGYTTQIRWMNQLAHKHRRETPDVSVEVGGGENQHRLLGMGNIVNEKDLDGMTEQDIVENFEGQTTLGTIYAISYCLAIALLIYRMIKLYENQQFGRMLSESLVFCCFPYVYFIYAIVMLIIEKDEPGPMDKYRAYRTETGRSF